MLELHAYQVAAVEHLQRNPRAALFLDMGLGKTAITLRSLTPDHLPALVVAPKRVAENVWATEAQLWRPDLSIAVAAGSPAQRLAALTTRADVVVIGRDNQADALPHVRKFRTLVMDEMSGYKTRGTTRWKTARRLVKDRPYVWGLTGTPAPNGLMDLWAQLFLLDGGERLGKNLTGFRSRYFVEGARNAQGHVYEYLIRPESSTRIHGLVEDICLSMTAIGRLDLPPVTYNVVSVPLPGPVTKLYETYREELVVDMEVLGGEIHTAANAAVLSSKLSQITAGFTYVDDADLRGMAYDSLHSEKVKAVQEIVEGTGSPVLVFYRFLPELEMLRAALPGACTIDEPDVIKRWNAGEVPVLLAHPAAAGHGLNLQYGGHTIVWTSLTWDLEQFQQGNGRLARQGQTQPVVVHILECPSTVDPLIHRRIDGKATVQDALRDHLESVF